MGTSYYRKWSYFGSMFLLWRVWVTKDLLGSAFDQLRQGNLPCYFSFSVLLGPVLLFWNCSDNQLISDLAAFGSGLMSCLSYFSKKLIYNNMQQRKKSFCYNKLQRRYQFSMLKFGEILLIILIRQNLKH